MLRLKDGMVELYKKVATSLPPDVEAALKEAYEAEPEGTNAKKALGHYLNEVKSARENRRVLCVETGVPVVFVKLPKGLSQKDVRNTIIEATRAATEKVPLSACAVSPLSNLNTGDNTGADFPEIFMEESPDETLTIELMLKGAGAENEGMLYSLPDKDLQAGRDLKGVAACVLDAISRAEGRGCPPYIVGVGIGATRDQVTRLSRDQLRRKLTDRNPDAELAAFEDDLLGSINELTIKGAGKVIALGVKVGAYHRHTDSFFVDVSFSCWATRRGKLIW